MLLYKMYSIYIKKKGILHYEILAILTTTFQLVIMALTGASSVAVLKLRNNGEKRCRDLNPIIWTYVCLLSFSQVVREVLLNVLHKLVGVFGVKVQHLVQALQADTLQVTVGQSFHVGICFNHPVV